MGFHHQLGSTLCLHIEEKGNLLSTNQHKQIAPNVILAKILFRYCNRFEHITYLTQSDFVINGYLFYFLPSVKA